MKLLQFIEQITCLYNKHGDIEVVINSGMGEDGYVTRVENIKESKVKTHEETYLFLTEYLKKGGWGGGSAFIQPYQRKIEKQEDISIIHIS